MIWLALALIFVVGLLAIGGAVVKAIWVLVLAPLFAMSAAVGVFLTLLPILFICAGIWCLVRWWICAPRRRRPRWRRFFW